MFRINGSDASYTPHVVLPVTRSVVVLAYWLRLTLLASYSLVDATASEHLN
jgi:hypothetical protein